MFGREYYRIEDQVGQEGHDMISQENYAASLLGKILDRAKVLNMVFLVGNPADLNSEEIKRAIHVFREDCDEAFIRGYRAGLFCDSNDAWSQWTEVPSDLIGLGVQADIPQLGIVRELREAAIAAWKKEHGGKTDGPDPTISLVDEKAERTKQRDGESGA